MTQYRGCPSCGKIEPAFKGEHYELKEFDGSDTLDEVGGLVRVFCSFDCLMSYCLNKLMSDPDKDTYMPEEEVIQELERHTGDDNEN